MDAPALKLYGGIDPRNRFSRTFFFNNKTLKTLTQRMTYGKSLQQTQIHQTAREASSRERADLRGAKQRRGSEFCRAWEQDEPVSVWVGTPEDYPETNTYEYERRYL